MKLQECIKSKKKDIIDLFCNIYGEYYRKHFSDRFDQITFLFPKLYFEDRDECYRELCNHQNNINPLPKIMLYDKLENNNNCGQFIPMLRQNGNKKTLHYFILIMAQPVMTDNLDVILLHELKHALTCNVNIIEYENNHFDCIVKVGLSCVEELYINNKICTSNSYYLETGEVLTQLDAEKMAYQLHQKTEIFPGQRYVPKTDVWYSRYFYLFNELNYKDIETLHKLELAPNYDLENSLSNPYFLSESELEINGVKIVKPREIIKYKR